MHLIVGLGNPGAKYEKTRHNVGFRVLDRLAEMLQEKWKGDRTAKAEVIETQYLGDKLVLAKPQTFMNLSGEAVQALAQKFKITPQNVWVAYDEAALPLGTIRVRLGGSAGGHNGIKSIIECLATDSFARFRVGINLPAEGLPLDAYVLQSFDKEERLVIKAIVDRTASLVLENLKDGVKEVSLEA